MTAASGNSYFVTDVPRHWAIKPIRSVAEYRISNVDKVPEDGELPIRLCNYTDVYNNESVHSSMELMETTATAEEISRFRLIEGDVVITKDSESWDDIAIPALVTGSAPDFVCGYHLAIVRPDRRRLLGEFLLRCLQAEGIKQQFQLAAVGVTRYGLPKAAIGGALIPVPPTSEQRRICDFLGSVTAEITLLIQKRQRLIELLDEKRAALISRAVTQGLDPSLPMKDSGLSWLGNLPSHWRSTSLRRLLVGIEQGISPVAEDCIAGPDEYGVLKLSAVKRGCFYPGEHKRLPDWPAMPNLIVRTGDLLLTRGNTPELVGDVCVVADIRQPLLLSDLIYRISVRTNEILPRFLMYILLYGYGRHQIQADARGSSGSMVKISQSHIREWFICLPPLGEQAAITAHCDAVEHSVGGVHAALTACIARLREYRSALITAAVTGQLDIREHEKKLEALT